MPQVKIAEFQLESARKNLDVAASLFQGEASLGYSQTWGELSAPSLAEPTDLSEGDWDSISISGRLNVVPFGPHAEAVQRAQWSLEQAERNLRDEKASALISLTEQFQNALLAKERVSLETQTLELAFLRFEAVSVQIEAGAANETQRLQADLAVAQAQESLRAAEQSGLQALQALSLSLGVTVSNVEGGLAMSQRLVSNSPLDARADVLSADTSVQDAEITIASGIRQALPTGGVSLGYSVAPEEGRFSLGASLDTSTFQPNLSASYDSDFSSPSALPEQNSQTFTLGLSLSIPIDVSVSSALDAVYLNLEQSELRAEQARELALLDITSKELQASSAEAQLELVEAQLKQEELLFEAAQVRFEAGLISMLELEQAKLDLANRYFSLVQTQNALRVAHMNLAFAYAMNPLEVYP